MRSGDCEKRMGSSACLGMIIDGTQAAKNRSTDRTVYKAHACREQGLIAGRDRKRVTLQHNGLPKIESASENNPEALPPTPSTFEINTLTVPSHDPATSAALTWHVTVYRLGRPRQTRTQSRTLDQLIDRSKLATKVATSTFSCRWHGVKARTKTGHVYVPG